MQTITCPSNFTRIASLFGLTLLSAFSIAQGQAIDSKTAAPAKDREVLLFVSAVDSQGRLVNGLNPAHFKLFADKAPQEITSFKEEEDEPASVVFMIDTSGSMGISDNSKASKVSFLIPAIADFIRSGSGASQYALLSFSEETRVDLDWSQDDQAISSALRAMAARSPKGKTAFHDACYEMLNLMRRATHRKKVVILLSDGEDNISKQSNFGKVRQALRESGLLIHTINIGALYDGPPPGSLMRSPVSIDGEHKLEDIAKDSGGFSFAVLDKFNLNAAFEYLSKALRSQYVIGFKPAPSAKPGNWRQLKIELKLPSGAPRELKSVSLKYPSGFLDQKDQK